MAPEANPTRADYRDSIELIADEIESDEYTDVEMTTDEMVRESVDSSQWIIYTGKALDVLRFSDHQPEEWNHLVGDGDTWQQVITAMAYDVMRQDVYEELRARGMEW